MHFDIRGHNRIHFFWQRTETSVRRGMRAEKSKRKTQTPSERSLALSLTLPIYTKILKKTQFLFVKITKKNALPI